MTLLPIRHRRRTAARVAGPTFAFTFAFAAAANTAAAAPATPREAPVSRADQLHALAVHSLRQGRFPEAYGRFVALADAGHAASARQALWMCEHGPARFGRDWDCAPEQVQDWAAAAAAGVAVPRLPGHEALQPRPEAPGGRRR